LTSEVDLRIMRRVSKIYLNYPFMDQER